MQVKICPYYKIWMHHTHFEVFMLPFKWSGQSFPLFSLTFKILKKTSLKNTRALTYPILIIFNDGASISPFHASNDVVHAHDPHSAVGPTVATPGDFPSDPYDMPLLPFYAHHIDRHIWE